MASTPLELELNEDRPIAGFASRIDAAEGSDDAELALELRQVADELGTGIPGDQSGPGDLFRSLIQRVRGRQLVADHGVHETEIPWLCLHVPRGGTARLQISDKASGSGGFKFSLVGTGLGDGWTFSAQEQRDLLERAHCTAVVEVFEVHVRAYAYQGREAQPEFRSDVISRIGTIVRELETCPLCEPAPGNEPVLARKHGPAVDLRADTVGERRKEEVTLTGTSELELGLKAKLPGDVGVSAGVTCKRELSSTCIVEYAFVGGWRYQPMRLMQLVDLPFWRVG